MSHPLRAAAALSALLLAGAVPGTAAPERPVVLRVAAAASLTDVFESLAARFPDARVEPSFGASSALARQIRDGFPADVFASAGADWVEWLVESGAADGEPVTIARNRLVCIAPARPGADGTALPRDPAALLASLSDDEGVAIADPGVPAGEYARAALETLGLLPAFEPHLVGQKDVRAVLHAVERGELGAGFVYATDAAVANVRVLFAFDPATHPAVEYRAVVVRGAPHPAEAHGFLEFLRGDAARAVLEANGFEVP